MSVKTCGNGRMFLFTQEPHKEKGKPMNKVVDNFSLQHATHNKLFLIKIYYKLSFTCKECGFIKTRGTNLCPVLSISCVCLICPAQLAVASVWYLIPWVPSMSFGILYRTCIYVCLYGCEIKQYH